MNIANKLTVLRILLVPVFVVLMLTKKPSLQVFAAVIFVLAALTDMLDGHLARSRNLVTTFGKFLDPLADKILASSAMILLVELGVLSSWMVILVIFREFAITGFRILAASQGITIAAGKSGKLKTIFQLVSLTLLLFSFPYTMEMGMSIGQFLFFVSILLTVISGVEYLAKNSQVLDLENM